MKEIDVIARLTVHAGKFDAFKAAAAACLAGVRGKERGALRYDWYLDAEGRTCVVLERYADSAAVLAHFANIESKLNALVETCDATLEMYGEVSPELRAATAGLSPAIYVRLQGL